VHRWGGIGAASTQLCALNTEKAASTPVEELQRQRQQRELRRAHERSVNQQSRLKERGRESQTSYGSALMQRYAEELGIALDALLSELVVNGSKAGPYFGYWPLLLHFSDRGPRSISAITLGVVIDQITARPKRSVLAQVIGRALQDELKATRIYKGKGRILFDQLKKKLSKNKVVSERVLSQLNVDSSGWTLDERRGLGNLLLEILAANTDLITFTEGKVPTVVPTAAVKELIASHPPRPLPARMLPSLVPPEPWTGLQRGSHKLISCRAVMDLDHFTTESLQTALMVVNAIERQELVIDPWMTKLQRQAWDCDIPGLFPVRREPEHRWSPPEESAIRVRIEESIRQAEEVAGLPIWLEHDLDFRGRMYCCSKFAGHQGPDQQKALVSFGQREPAGEEGFAALLAAAAGHYGLGHSTWAERLQWGKEHLDLMDSVATNPLDLVDAWKGADDPWQFMQACRAVSEYLADPATPLGVPVRYDQTCSGMGIIGALTRDARLCQLTNITGDRREDLYTHVANVLLNQLRMDLDSWDPRDVRLAEFWLKKEIKRDLTKGPTMTTIYGARHFGIVDQLVEWLQEKNPDVPVALWQREYTVPAQYLAKKIGVVIGAELRSCVDVETWLRKVSLVCTAKQQTIRWQSPMDFPLSFGCQVDEKQRTHTALHGSRRWKRVDAGAAPGELSARATGRGITANTIHAFDAALVHAVVLRCAVMGVPLLTNHDCFATIPAKAHQLHRTLLDELRTLYMPEWLPEIRVEIGKNAGVRLPHPPRVGDLSEGLIGQNPYCFC
jgi:DNA-directed RNA polymerase